MYCSSCGSPGTPGLSYCNRCGTELGAKKPMPASVSESLIWAIVAVSVGGLALIIGLMAVMKHELHFDNQMILLISLLSFLSLLAAESVFIWMILSSARRTRRQEKEQDGTVELRGPATKELAEPAHLLTEPIMSVTEQTTRTLEPVSRERKDS